MITGALFETEPLLLEFKGKYTCSHSKRKMIFKGRVRSVGYYYYYYYYYCSMSVGEIIHLEHFYFWGLPHKRYLS